METLVLNGKQYVKASKAARDLGYTSDYVGQLCRGGHVDAHLVGRTWYVNADTLTNHQVEKKRNSRVKAREYAKKAIEESKTLKVHESKKGYKDIAIRYADDKQTLIPQVRKVTVERSPIVEPVLEEDTTTPAYTIENEHKKIVMSGTLKIQDAENAPSEVDTVTLRPSFKRSTSVKTKVSTESIRKIEVVEANEAASVSVAPKSFAERIQDYQDSETLAPLNAVVDQPLPFKEREPVKSAMLYYVLLTILAIVAGLSVFVEKEMIVTSQFTTSSFHMNFSTEVLNGL